MDPRIPTLLLHQGSAAWAPASPGLSSCGAKGEKAMKIWHQALAQSHPCGNHGWGFSHQITAASCLCCGNKQGAALPSMPSLMADKPIPFLLSSPGTDPKSWR